jgi:hypothetical protein
MIPVSMIVTRGMKCPADGSGERPVEDLRPVGDLGQNARGRKLITGASLMRAEHF